MTAAHPTRRTVDFFGHQDRARRKTRLLVFYFACAVVAITAGVYLGLAAIFEWREARWADWNWMWRPALLLYATLGTLVVIAFGTLIKFVELRAGGPAIANGLGGRLLSANATNPDERRLLNVVEEMAIASGVPVPQTYLLPHEDGINAFAAGYSAGDAVVGVTRGCLQHLNRDELQGVIAHEFSHIVNGDMRLNLRLIGLLHGILCLALIGRFLLRSSGGSSRRSRSDKGGNVLVLVGLLLYVVGSAGAFFGALIKAAVSRQREFLADAASVQFTRNPDGMAGALKKIGGLAAGSALEHPNAAMASHMYFACGLRESWFTAFATHPRLLDRIRAIEPTFDGRFPRLAPAPSAEPEPATGPAGPPPRRSPVPAIAAVPAAAFLAAVPGPTQQRVAFATDFRDSLAEDLLEAAHHPLSASAIVYGLVLSRDPDTRAAELDGLETRLDSPSRGELTRVLPLLERVSRSHRLPLLQVAAPALRELSPEQFTRFEAAVQFLVEFDGQIDLFDLTLQYFIRRQLAPVFRAPPRRPAQYYSLRPLTLECGTLLSALAHLSGEDGPAREEAFHRGVAPLGALPGILSLRPLSDCGVSQISAALDALNELTPALKKVVLTGGAQVVAHDGVIQPDEAELLRAIADALDCPIPPLIEGV